MNNDTSAKISLFIAHIRNSIWILGIPSCLFGITDRSLASLADGYLSAIDLTQLFTASFLLLAWLSLKPEESLNTGELSRCRFNAQPNQPEFALREAQARMFQLRAYHAISQEYILPFSYVCQIYHLLNLKHLESIHAFSLNNLKILKVTHFQPTATGGIIKFQTILDSPFNILRIWRLPVVEVILILYAPYTVELCIPVYNGKKIVVMFNVQPISETEHKLLIDIYSNLEWPKPILQMLLHFASCLTLFEDLPYLHKISQKNLAGLVNLNRVSNHETMRLFRRFVELYGSAGESSQPAALLESTELPALKPCETE
ncbi:hypothetical protein [Microcoleus sp. FACHB-68]|uniref:hypothetical protein n=1 Tax=Microcoleus sp. FACHB-68 TaxID=2692826 RepID=UPI001685B30C|nr:hypothetical protein [Microcoleus sp. FACHB-68]MBD1936663.1 hypothetical protein [Microcoleus sp. FACHB-68]